MKDSQGLRVFASHGSFMATLLPVVMSAAYSRSFLRAISQGHPTVFWIFSIFSLVMLGITMFCICLLVVWTIWTRILISSSLFPLRLGKFRDIYVFRRLTTVSFVLLPAIILFVLESSPVFFHLTVDIHYGVTMPPPCCFLLKTAFLSNSSLYTMDLPLLSCPLCQNTTLWKRKAELNLAWLEGLKRPEPLDPSLLLLWFSVTFEMLCVIFAIAVSALMNDLHGRKNEKAVRTSTPLVEIVK